MPKRDSRRGWLVWAVAATMFAYAFFHRVSPSVMFDHLMRDFAISAALVGNLSACYFYAYAGMQLPVGVMLDRWGPRLLLAIAGLVAAAGSLIFALSESLLVAYLGRILIGAGSGVVFIATLQLAMQWLPPHRFALVTGLTQAVAMIGAVSGQAPLGALIEVTGWRTSMLLGAGLGLVLAIIIWFAARPPEQTVRHGPQGLPPPAVLAGVAVVFRNRQSWLVGLYSAFMSVPMLSFGVLWGVPYLMQVHGLGRAAAGASASLLLLGWALGAPSFGWLSDRMGRRRPVMLATTAAALIGWLSLVAIPSLPLLLIYPLLFALGIASSSMSLTFAVGREVNPPEVSGLAIGFVNFASIAAAAVTQPFIGWLLDLNWDGRLYDGARVFDVDTYRIAFLPFPLMAAASLAAAWFLTETYCRQHRS